ncbi:hypothetical protein GCM10010912_69040 [Paenibacillus albidus]|uniref:Uncharacterized protein n=1 Tax=Paenibacillus albidus TaxID=2041023 RepID=A0A917FZ26_9BACL|nr:hypothetical protein [Paenibacillus albidus]GGG14815.1 hypothetical protein GCM10010912_69040 [Paenibacillus albidus]
MSRSVKRQPVFSDQQKHGASWAKMQAAKAVRRYPGEIPRGKWYRKLYCSWNICDYSFYTTKEQAVQEWETESWRKMRFPSRVEAIQEWSKFYRRK